MSGLRTDQHPRDSLAKRYVYSVLSRRAGGISLGLNLNPDRICNWSCAYCQVARDDEPKRRQPVDLERARAELSELLESVASGELLSLPQHRDLPEAQRRVVDLSFSGDGEPTTCPHFPALIDHVIAERSRLGLELELIVLSNNSVAHKPAVRGALERLAAAGGCLHVKLDAGDETGYARVDRTTVPWAKSIDNLRMTARIAPVVIQTLICAVDGRFMGAEELRGYVGLLRGVLDGGGAIERIDLHSVARRPPFENVRGLPESYLQALAARMIAEEPRLTGRIRVTAGRDEFLLAGAPSAL